MISIDVVYSTSGFYANHFAGYRIKQRFNKPWVVDFCDEWSNNPVVWQKKDTLEYYMCVDCEAVILKYADHVLCVTERSEENYRNLGVPKDKVTCITNGYDEDDFTVLTEEKTRNDKFTIVHNDLLYANRTPTTVPPTPGDVSEFNWLILIGKHAGIFNKTSELDLPPIYDESDTDCIGCGSAKTKVAMVRDQSITANNYSVLNPFRTWKECADCGLIFAGNMPSPEALDKYYSAHYIQMQEGGKNYAISEAGNEKEYFRRSKNRIDRIGDVAGKKGRLLDIGAGMGTFAKVAADNGWDVEGLEFSEERVAYAKKTHGITLKQQDFFELDTVVKYDAITMFEVIEHLIRPWDALAKCAALLNGNGILVIATPFRDSEFVKTRQISEDFWWNEPSHLTYMDTQTLINACAKHGLHLVHRKDSEDGAGRLELYFMLEASNAEVVTLQTLA